MRTLLALSLFSFLLIVPAPGAAQYTLGPDSEPKPGVPQGRVEAFTYADSTVFPGTTRECWLYVPAQYDGSKPAALMVFQDGRSYVMKNGQIRVPIVFDNLIHAGEMPITIGLFVNPGSRGSGSNRSFEYDSLGDAYSRFLIEELIPHVASEYGVKISADPELRAICGMSSGAICAFTVAWERPDQFRKVLSHIGSFTNIRGGHVYPALIRKTERKPIRVFLQDGANDLNNLHGDWPLSNRQMASALRFAGYDHRFVLGEGSHSGQHGGAILPESLRWLWRSQTHTPDPLTKDNLRGDEALVKVLPAEEGWELVGEGYEFTDAACVDQEGRFYFSDLPKGRLHRVERDGAVTAWLENGPKISGMKFGPDGRLYAATQGAVGAKPQKQIIAIDPETKEITEIATRVDPNDLVVSRAGWVYFTDTGAGQVQRVPITARSMPRPPAVAGGIVKPNGISLSADQKFLLVSEYGGSNVWSYVIAEDGSLTAGERYMTLRTPLSRAESGGDGMATDSQNRSYVTSFSGIQMFDGTGRMGGVISKPSDAPCVSVAFAGEGRHYLHACAQDKVWRRRMLAEGVEVR